MRAHTSWHARTTGKPLVGLLVGAILALTGFTLVSPMATPPAAATRGTLGEGIHVPLPGYGETWLGAFEVPTGADGAMSWCIQMWVPPGVGAPPVTVTVQDDPVLAWLIETYADPANALDQAAIAYTVHQRAEVPGVVAAGDAERAKQLLAAAAPAEVRARSAAMVAAAEAQAGPYRDPTPGVQDDDLRFGTVTDLGVVSASGSWVPGLTATVELLETDGTGSSVPTGRAVFDLNGNHRADPEESNVWTGRTPDGPLTLPYVATGIGEVVARARFSGLRTTTLVRYGMEGSRQDTLSLTPGLPGGPTERSVSSPVFLVAHGFRVTGTSQVQDKVVDPGQPICDTLSLRAEPGHTWLPVGGTPVTVPLIATPWRVGTLPATEGEEAPASARPLAEIRVEATGPGDYRACLDPGIAAVTAPGVVSWQWRTDRSAMPTEQRGLLLADWQDTFALPEESVSLRHTPEVVTSLSIRATGGGLRLVDDLWAEGYPDDHGDFPGGAGFGADHGQERTELWFFPADVPVSDAALGDGSATLIGSVDRDAVNGYHSLSSPSFAWPTTGTDTDADGVPDPRPGTVAARTVFAGDDRTRPVSTSVTDPTEQFSVAPEPLAVTTAVQTDRDAGPGAELVLADTTEVTGAVPPDGLLLSNDLYRWSGADPVCSPETLIAAGDPIAVTAPGGFRSQDVTVTAEPGSSYGYVETARNQAGQVVHRGRCGADEETVRVPAAPEVLTTARAAADHPAAGDDLWDTVTWRGEFPAGSTTTVELFHAAEGQELTCSADTRVWTSAPITVEHSPGTADTDHHRTAAPGTYGFVETTRDPAGTTLSTGVCGEPAETITVTAPAAGPGLATTGAAVTGALAFASAAVAAGVLALRLRHPRRQRSHGALGPLPDGDTRTGTTGADAVHPTRRTR